MADSHYELGDKDTCDQLYNAWLEENPDWGWGYIGWVTATGILFKPF
jgi:hypothetical protein